VFLTRDASGRWRGIYWPRTPGWHTLAGDGSPVFYIQSAGSWVGVRAGLRRAASLEASVTAERGERVTRTALVVPARPMPLGWAFALFLVAAGYLWSERRRLVPRREVEPVQPLEARAQSRGELTPKAPGHKLAPNI
jgi:hypothetical protein